MEAATATCGVFESSIGILVAGVLVGLPGMDGVEQGVRIGGYSLACFTGVLFIMLGQAMTLCDSLPRVQQAGLIMQRRVLNTVANWRDHTLRSFLEMISWMYVIFRTYSATQDAALALALGTLSGCGMVLLGEQFSQHLRELDKEVMLAEGTAKGAYDGSSLLQLNISWLLFFALVIAGHLGNLQDLVLGFWLATLTGIGFITFGQLLLVWQPTYSAGVVLQRRVTKTRENWSTHPLRSALEVSSYSGVIFASFAVWKDPFFSVLAGTAGGAIICLSSEYLLSAVTGCSNEAQARLSSAHEPKEGPVLVPICLGFYVLYAVVNHFHDTCWCVVLAVMAGLAIVTIGRLFVICPRTRSAGILLQNRVLKTGENWRKHTIRSAFESSLFACTVVVTMRLEHDFCLAMKLATAVGCAAALVNEGIHAVCRRRKSHQRRTQSLSADPDRQVTWKELKKHVADDDCWIAVHGKVYDITSFVAKHPGGSIITSFAGRDASDEFEAFHLPRVRHRLPSMCIGTLTGSPAELPSTRDYRQLRTRLWKEGWFECDTGYVMCKDGLAACILLIGLYWAATGSNWFVRTLMGGSAVGLAFQQVAFVAHDAGHRGIRHPQPGGGINWLGWLHGTVLFGVSAEMWLDEHSRHHAMTMRPREDPQFNYLPLWLVSEKELQKFSELMWVERVAARFLVPIQHFTLIPLSTIVGRFNIHAISLIWAIKNKKVHDVIGLLLYTAWYSAIVSLIPSAAERLAFVLISYTTAGVLHVQLTISHLATDCFTADEDEIEQFFAFQCKTTRNIDTAWWDDWLHGGLQYQIEHHLFPQMPRHYLGQVKPMVMELCNKHGLPYRSTSFTGAVAECLSDFKRLSQFVGDLAHPHEIMPE